MNPGDLSMLGGLSVPLFLLKITGPPQLWAPHCPTLAECPACTPPHTLSHTLPAAHLAAPPSSGPSLGVSTSLCPQLGRLLKVPVLQWGGGQPPPQLSVLWLEPLWLAPTVRACGEGPGGSRRPGSWDPPTASPLTG